MEDKKIFLDSGIIISLGLVHNGIIKELSRRQKTLQLSGENIVFLKSKGRDFYEFSDDGINEIKKIINENKENIKGLLESESVNILDQDVENLCDLYIKIINKEITALVVPTVYKEVCIDPTTSKANETKNFFNYCSVAVPKSEYSEDFAQQTVLFADDYKVDKFDTNKPDEHYGLADDVHSKDAKSVDVNNEDRWLLSQTELISRLDSKIQFFNGANIDYDFIMHDGKEISLTEYIKDLCDLTSVFDIERELITVKKLDSLTSQNKKYLLLHENEKDFGREINGKRSRTYKISNEKSNRNEKLMNEVAEELNSSLKNCELVTPNSRVLEWFLSNENEYNVSIDELVKKNNLKKLEIKELEIENEKKLQQELDCQEFGMDC